MLHFKSCISFFWGGEQIHISRVLHFFFFFYGNVILSVFSGRASSWLPLSLLLRNAGRHARHDRKAAGTRRPSAPGAGGRGLPHAEAHARCCEEPRPQRRPCWPPAGRRRRATRPVRDERRSGPACHPGDQFLHFENWTYIERLKRANGERKSLIYSSTRLERVASLLPRGRLEEAGAGPRVHL